MSYYNQNRTAMIRNILEGNNLKSLIDLDSMKQKHLLT